MNPRLAFLISSMECVHSYMPSLIISASSSAYNPVVMPQGSTRLPTCLRRQFCRGLRGDVKKLLLNFLEPTSLNEAITQAVRCDNCLFEICQEERTSRQISSRPSFFWPSSSQSPNPPYVPNQVSTTDSPTPMEIDKVGP